jgi:hypothetical protein
VLLVVIIAMVFGVYAGWHWKILHRAITDVSRYKASVKVAKKAEMEHWPRAVFFAVVALIVLDLLAHMH